MENGNYRFAVLVDSENANHKDIRGVLDQVSILGGVYIKRIYGDFTSSQSSSWREAVNELSLTPIQQFSYTSGKNATDSKMVIDAMDILYQGKVNAFCLVSSDSDFTGLAKRLKESGMFVLGAGKDITPKSFVSSCDRFILVDEKNGPLPSAPVNVLNQTTSKINTDGKISPVTSMAAKREVAKEDDVVTFAIKAFESDSDSSISLSQLMEIIYRRFPGFLPSDYQCKKASDFFRKHKQFEVRGSGPALTVVLLD
jgi:uncharacterized LabA/DUF88 family protein